MVGGLRRYSAVIDLVNSSRYYGATKAPETGSSFSGTDAESKDGAFPPLKEVDNGRSSLCGDTH